MTTGKRHSRDEYLQEEEDSETVVGKVKHGRKTATMASQSTQNCKDLQIP